MKVAIVTCYKQPDYGRAVALRAGLVAIPNVQTIVIKNRHRGLLRYLEVILRTLAVRWRQHPDVYLLTFRGYEMLPAILLIALGKPVILDELINPLEVVSEHRQLYHGGIKSKLMAMWSLFGGLYTVLLRRCRLVIADTTVHAQYSSRLSKVSLDKYRVIPVGADESIFKSGSHPVIQSSSRPVEQSGSTDNFMVLYYGSMVPLHGLKFVLAAAEQLKDQPRINFLLVGGGKKASLQIADSKAKGAHIEYRDWIDADKLPTVIARAGLCLGGPFGDTLQSQLVTTGKTYQFLASAAPVLLGETQETQTSQLFKDKRNCLMVLQGDAQVIAEAIQWAAAHPKELAKIGLAGYELYQKHFSEKVISQKLASLLNELS